MRNPFAGWSKPDRRLKWCVFCKISPDCLIAPEICFAFNIIKSFSYFQLFLIPDSGAISAPFFYTALYNPKSLTGSGSLSSQTWLLEGVMASFTSFRSTAKLISMKFIAPTRSTRYSCAPQLGQNFVWGRIFPRFMMVFLFTLQHAQRVKYQWFSTYFPQSGQYPASASVETLSWVHSDFFLKNNIFCPLK